MGRGFLRQRRTNTTAILSQLLTWMPFRKQLEAACTSAWYNQLFFYVFHLQRRQMSPFLFDIVSWDVVYFNIFINYLEELNWSTISTCIALLNNPDVFVFFGLILLLSWCFCNHNWRVQLIMCYINNTTVNWTLNDETKNSWELHRRMEIDRDAPSWLKGQKQI